MRSTPLERALDLAEPEGYVRVFVDEGAADGGRCCEALTAAAALGRTRAACSAPSTPAAASRRPRRPAPVHPALVEPLSARELDVLRLLGSDLDGPDIARELVVSLNTLRTHTRNIYAKLGVNNRREAVRRAGELGLLSRTGRR